MPRSVYTVRNANGDERTISMYSRPATIVIQVADERHDTGVNAAVDSENKLFGTPKTYQWVDSNNRYEEVV